MNLLLVEFARFQNLYPHAGNFTLLLMKSTVILLMATGVSALLKGQSARARNWVWRCALAGLLGLALWQCLPGSQGLVTVHAKPTSFPAASTSGTIFSPDAQATNVLPMSSDGPGLRESAALSGLRFIEAWSVWLWLGIASVLVMIHSLRSAGATLWLRRHASRVETPEEKALAGMDLYLTPALDTPLLAGLLRPAIYLPENSRDWTQEKRRCVLLHEKAHRTRGDLAWQFAGTCACCLWWWNPLSWMALTRLKSEAEQAADDMVVLHEGTAEPYARHLVEIAAGFTRQAPAGVPMLGRSPLEQRIRSILDRTLLRNRIGTWSGSLLGVLSCFIFSCLTLGVALGEVDLTNKWGNVVHYQADPAQNKLLQGNFVKTGGKLEGWTGSLDSVSPEKGMIRLKAAEQETAIETSLPCDPAWEWLTVMAKTRPAGESLFVDGQHASISFTPVDASGKSTAPATVLLEKRNEGYANWANWIRTIRVPAGTQAVNVRVALAPGKGGLDCQEIGIVPSREEDELDHRLVDRFFEALKASDEKTVLTLLKQEPKLVGARGFTDNGTPLILCAWNELPDMARILIDHGADLEAVDYGAWRSTALMWCGWWGSARTADVLIKAGANAKARSINGVTPLSSAKSGKKNNRFSKASPDAFDQTIALMTAAEKTP
ncbi:MAG: hypothetical protein K0R17_1508 [Rariglobus sp.]|jgi:beta-lactamase regulating signal transducer with metallopeptidase domain|nr:hypothetical protein [Rariglobus sp.]